MGRESRVGAENNERMIETQSSSGACCKFIQKFLAELCFLLIRVVVVTSGLPGIRKQKAVDNAEQFYVVFLTKPEFYISRLVR